MEKTYLILCRKQTHGTAIWWRPKAAGYTNDVKEAGRYTQAEAIHWEHIHQGAALAVPEDALLLMQSREVIHLEDARNAAWLDVVQRSHYRNMQPQNVKGAAA